MIYWYFYTSLCVYLYKYINLLVNLRLLALVTRYAFKLLNMQLHL